jgi:fumarylacetoacetase
MNELDRSHDPARTSWVESANGHAVFPIQNLPYGSTEDGIVVAIGDQALLLPAALEQGWGAELPLTVTDFSLPFLNMFLFESPAVWHATRLALSDALSDPAWRERLAPALRPIGDLTLGMPFHAGDYTDFYASVHHATNVGSMFRPDNPLLPNYKWVPIGYHGRSSTLVPSGTLVRRPHGQVRPAGEEQPRFGPSRSLDYELELGLVLGGLNPYGQAVPAAEAMARIFGVVLLNDWSARDLQAWEYQPLGPFLAKNFASTVSPWVVTTDALRPYRVPMPARPEGDPAPLEYLRVPDDHTWRLELDVELRSSGMRDSGAAPFRVSRADFATAMYWSPAQLVTHHASNGCVLNPGDLLGTGTISGPGAAERGCLLERTWRGAEPLTLPDGSTRAFLEDGDEVILRGRALAPGRPTLGFGECTGVVAPAA